MRMSERWPNFLSLMRLLARGYLQVWAASFGTQVSFCPFALSCWQQPLAHWGLVVQGWPLIINAAVHLPLTQVP